MAAERWTRDEQRAKPAAAAFGRLALSKREAADALGVSVDFLEQHVMHELRIVRRGRRRLIPVRELERWLEDNSARVLDAERLGRRATTHAPGGITMAGTKQRGSSHPGIEVRHSARCARSSGAGRCTCSPKYRAKVHSKREKRWLKRSFDTLAEAKAWRAEADVALRRGALRAALTPTVAELAAAWVAGARSGAIRNRSGDVYKPSTVRSYEEALRLRVLPELGAVRLSELASADVQAFVDRLLASGANAGTIRNSLMPLRAICRRAKSRGDIAVNPTRGVELPAVRGTRDRIASAQEAAALLAALSRDQALWATALYAGLRRGELLGLMWDCVDFDRGVIHVRRSWDVVDGLIEPKSRAGYRFVPMASALRRYLAAHQLACPWREGLVFGRTADAPFAPATPTNRARKRWLAAGLNPITLHECRHTFASLMIAAGVNAHALKTYMGHSTVAFTFDRYGHLMPGNEAEAAALLDRYLA